MHTASEDYRASAGIDLVHDQQSRDQGLKVGCDLLVLWGERAVVYGMFKPLELWHGHHAPAWFRAMSCHPATSYPKSCRPSPQNTCVDSWSEQMRLSRVSQLPSLQTGERFFGYREASKYLFS